MTPVGRQAWFYRTVILPEEHFEEIIPEGLGILTLICYPLKPGFTYEPGHHTVGWHLLRNRGPAPRLRINR